MYARGLARDRVVVILGTATAIAIGVEIARHSWAQFGALFERLVGGLLKDEEHTALTGATWLFGACLAVVVLLPRHAAVAVLWCAIAGDPAASVAGRAWQRRAGGRASRGKSNVGSIACLAVSTAGAWGIGQVSPWAALAIALAGTLTERLPLPFDDNASVAAGAGIAAWLVT